MNRYAQFLASLLGAMFAIGSALCAETTCSALTEFIGQQRQEGMRQYMLTTSRDEKGEEQYLNIDLDGDDINDEVKGGCPGSAQTFDACTLSVRLSTGKKQLFAFEAGERFYLFRFHGRIYGAASSGIEKNLAPATIGLDRNGVSRICRK